MPITDNKNYPFSFSMIDIKKIDPSPYQHRKYFDENSLRELGKKDLGKIWCHILLSALVRKDLVSHLAQRIS